MLSGVALMALIAAGSIVGSGTLMHAVHSNNVDAGKSAVLRILFWHIVILYTDMKEVRIIDA